MHEFMNDKKIKFQVGNENIHLIYMCWNNAYLGFIFIGKCKKMIPFMSKPQSRCVFKISMQRKIKSV